MSESHLWLLHCLFLDQINEDCEQFQYEWNAHPISGPSTNNKSPQVGKFTLFIFKVINVGPNKDLRLLGQARHGVYRDECEGIHPDIIKKYYGVDGKPAGQALGITGAGNPPDEEDANSTEPPLAVQVENDQQSQVRHNPIGVPAHTNPFHDINSENLFWQVICDVVEQDIMPQGVGLLSNEWDDGTYPSFEVLQVGNRGTKNIHFSLEDAVWFHRAKLWGQALTVLDISLANL